MNFGYEFLMSSHQQLSLTKKFGAVAFVYFEFRMLLAAVTGVERR